MDMRAASPKFYRNEVESKPWGKGRALAKGHRGSIGLRSPPPLDDSFCFAPGIIQGSPPAETIKIMSSIQAELIWAASPKF